MLKGESIPSLMNAIDHRQYPGLLALFAQQVQDQPEATALIYKKRRMSYRVLDEQSNHLAHWLYAHMAQHKGKKTFIPFCLGRSVEQVVILLAILKAGGAYIPLDRCAPPARNIHILQDIEASILITDESTHADMQALFGDHQTTVTLLNIETSRAQIHATPASQPQVPASDLAYVMYTSGSTGLPKGALIPRCAIVRLVYQTNYIDITTDDCFMQAASVSFDAATFEIWGALLNGARLVIVDTDVAVDPKRLRTLLVEEQVTSLFMTTGLFNQHIAADPTMFASVRYVMFGGEAASVKTIRDLWDGGQRPEHLYNVYGPTENTTFSTFYPILSKPEENSPIPIGYAISETCCHVVDEQMQRVPAGGSGELLLGGMGLADGYLNRPDLNAEKFIDSPFNGCDKLYHTGDLVELHEDGALVFIGRIDNQVKVRGFRIELEEVELVLGTAPGVGEVVVLAESDVTATLRLVAYLRAADDQTPPNPADLRAYIERSLPPYMVPAEFRLIQQCFPLGLTGKVDRRALTSTPYDVLDAQITLVAPRNEMEQVLCDTWASYLCIAPAAVGVESNFYELGGQSLLAAGIVQHIAHHYDVELTLGQFLANPTIAKLAVTVEAAATRVNMDIPALGQKRNLPLSWSQEQIWLHQQVDSEAVYYNEPLDIDLPECINPAAMEQALHALLMRHESLRIQLAWVEGRPLQHIEPLLQFHLPLVDLRHIPLARRQSEATRLATQLAKQPFDLEHKLPIRFLLVRLEDEHFRLYLTGHHIALDGVGMFQVFLPELESAYRAYQQKQMPSLPELSFSWCDWLLWQRSEATRQCWDRQLQYWVTQLADIQPLDLPVDHANGAKTGAAGARIPLEINSHLTLRLTEFARDQKSSLFSLLLGAFQLLLYRYTQQNDIAIGSVVAGRSLPGLNQHVCDTLNTVVLRTKIPEGGNFLDLLAACQTTCHDAFSHQDVPFQLVARHVSMDGSRGRGVPIQVAFVLEPGLPATSSGWEMNQLEVHTDTAKFDITIELDERQGRIIGRVEYRTGLFTSATIERLIQHYLTLLQEVVNDPSCPLATLPLMESSERQRILYDWNDTSVEYHGPATLHALIEQRAEQCPDAPAIITDDKIVTFAELVHGARGVAQQLLAMGLQRGQRVGVWMNREAGHLIAQLAVLQAGGCYVPLAVSDPIERATMILDDAEVQVVLVDPSHAEKLHDYAAPTLLVDHCSPLSGKLQPEVLLAREDLAYIIYTSGSTGQPKGAMINHDAIVERTMWAVANMRMGPHDASIHLSSMGFDGAVISTWWTLAAGAAVVLPSDNALQDAEVLTHLIQRHAVSHMFATPALWNILVDRFKHEKVWLSWASAGGERLSAELLQNMRTVAGRVINGYGPTETTVFSTIWEDDGRDTDQPPIGGPIGNVKLYVLDPRGEPVPTGVRGELYIGGAGVGCGYLNMPERSEAAFVNNPFATGTMYRTGDIVRWLTTGELEYLGRVDHQVKIRGFRIEPGEIEAYLLNLPEVSEAIVTVPVDEHGTPRLIAHIVGNNTLDVRSLLRQQLPEAMVPSAIVFMDALPLTVNGKVDVRALPKPAATENSIHEAPTDSFEAMLLQHFNSVIAGDMGVTDDFFDVGGDSLSAMQLTATLATAGFSMTVKELMRHRTPRALAELLRRSEAAAQFAQNAPQFHGQGFAQPVEPVDDVNIDQAQLRADDALLPLREEGELSPLFFVHPAGGSAVCYQHLAAYLPQQPFYGLECVDGYLGKTMVGMATEYLQAIRQVQPQGPYYIGGWSFGGNLAFEMALQLERAGEEVALLVMVDSRPLDHPKQVQFLHTMNTNSAAIHCLIGRHFAQMSHQKEPISYAELSATPEAERRQRFLDAVNEAEMFPPELAETFVRRFVDDFQACTRIMADYQLVHKPEANVLLLRASEVSTHYEGFPAMEESLAETSDISYGWKKLTYGRVTVFSIPGSHETCVFPPNVSKTAMLIRNELARFSDLDSGYYNALPSLTADQWERVLTHMDHIAVTPGNLLIEVGQCDRTVYLVSNGLLEIQAGDIKAEVGPGTILGEVSFIDGKPRTASICALTETSVYSLTPESFHSLEQAEPEIASAILLDLAQVVSKRFREVQG